MTSFAIVAGAAGGGLSPTVVLVLGFSNIFADALRYVGPSYDDCDDRAAFVSIFLENQYGGWRIFVIQGRKRMDPE